MPLFGWKSDVVGDLQTGNQLWSRLESPDVLLFCCFLFCLVLSFLSQSIYDFPVTYSQETLKPIFLRNHLSKTSSNKKHQQAPTPMKPPKKKLLTCQSVFSNNQFHTTLQGETAHELQITLVRVFRLSFVVEFFCWGVLGRMGGLWVANLAPPNGTLLRNSHRAGYFWRR